MTTGAEQWAAANTPGAAATDPAVSAQMAAREARLELDRHNSTWLYGHDIYQLDFILCVAIAGGSTEDGERLWGIVVNASSSAKSEGIKMLFGVADTRLSDLTAAGLISWIGTGKNMRVTGLLTKLPSPAFVLIEDLAPILSDTADTRNRSKLVAILRKVYDGEVQRDLGGTPGQAAWSGKVTVLAASTKVIDQQSALLDEAGPRWLLYRGKETGAGNRLSGTGRRIDSRQRAEARQRARELATAVVRHGRAAFASMELSDQAAGTLGDIAVAVGILRGSVPRDGYRRGYHRDRHHRGTVAAGSAAPASLAGGDGVRAHRDQRGNPGPHGGARHGLSRPHEGDGGAVPGWPAHSHSDRPGEGDTPARCQAGARGLAAAPRDPVHERGSGIRCGDGVWNQVVEDRPD